MQLIIDDSKKISDIQKEFSSHFPFLKLEFFGAEPEVKRIYAKPNRIEDKNKTLAEIRKVHVSGNISIHGNLKVSTLEENFKTYYGINVQVYKKSGNTWLQTTSTDNWTLKMQNKWGEEMSTRENDSAEKDFDQYHEQA